MTDRMMEAFTAICDCGGRQSGTESERRAVALLSRLGADASGVEATREPVPYETWRATGAALTLAGGTAHALHPLIRCEATPPGGIEAEVVDLGRGTAEEFTAHAAEIPGNIVLVRHELMFAAGTIHRRIKLKRAIDAGAVAFLIAGPAEETAVAGSAAVAGETSIPAAGISPATARALGRTAAGRPRARLEIDVERAPSSADNLFFDMPGPDPGAGWVVLSAHIDGHNIGESAIDNASGLAVALEVVRRVLPRRASWARGLRLAFFNVEEWALTGSQHHVAALGAAEREAIALNVNLDSVGGGDALTALTSGFARLEPFLLQAAERAGVPLGLYRPLQVNSDHANFAKAGIPAFRLVAGFGNHGAAVRNVLTAKDARGAVTADELGRAATLTEAIVEAALLAPAHACRTWREGAP